MAREKVGSDLMQVRFPDGTFDRIAATGISRPRFIRDAVEAALGGSSDLVAKINTAEVIPARKPAPQKKKFDCSALG